MGRQKTIWINEDRNAKLESIVGESMSEKIGMCIDAYQVDNELLTVALRAQIRYLKLMMKDICKDLRQRNLPNQARELLACRIEEEIE